MSEGGARPARRGLTADDYVAGVLAGDRATLGRAITLVESEAPAHAELAAEVLRRLAPRAGGALRVGLTGPPGVGKSTLVEALGLRLCAAGRRLAVLAVDPSSAVSGGSILGDKTRMESLSRQPGAFIRPSPSGGTLGGVARKTRESVIVCEAAGFDTVIVETVGVGQSETAVRQMVDCFVLLLLAGAGDELQAIKRGVVELADLLAITKADGQNRAAAEAAQASYRRALRDMPQADPGWRPRVLTCSALTGEGVAELWGAVEEFRAQAGRSGALEARRRGQVLAWLDELLADGLRRRLAASPAVAARMPEVRRAVAAGELPASLAAGELLALFEGRPGGAAAGRLEGQAEQAEQGRGA